MGVEFFELVEPLDFTPVVLFLDFGTAFDFLPDIVAPNVVPDVEPEARTASRAYASRSKALSK